MISQERGRHCHALRAARVGLRYFHFARQVSPVSAHQPPVRRALIDRHRFRAVVGCSMDLFELENLDAIRIALVMVGILGVLDLAIGHLSGSMLALPCAVGSVGIKAYQESKNRRRQG